VAVAVTEYDSTEAKPNQIALLDVSSNEWSFATDPGMLAASPVWSPDGRRLAFIGVEPAPDPAFQVHRGDPGMDVRPFRKGLAIYLLDYYTGAVGRLTSPNGAWDSRPTWSADGARLLYMRGYDGLSADAPTRYQVRVVSVAGGDDAVLLDHVDQDWAYFAASAHEREE
jgi:Tol biopolymer transport system component